MKAPVPLGVLDSDTVTTTSLFVPVAGWVARWVAPSVVSDTVPTPPETANREAVPTDHAVPEVAVPQPPETVRPKLSVIVPAASAGAAQTTPTTSSRPRTPTAPLARTPDGRVRVDVVMAPRSGPGGDELLVWCVGQICAAHPRAGGRRLSAGRQPLGLPGDEPADHVCRPREPEGTQRIRRKARGVALGAQHDDLDVVPRGLGQAGVGGGVEAPFEDVALDDQRPGHLALDGPLCGRADVDQQRPAGHAVRGLRGGEADQAAAGVGEQLVDRAGPGGPIQREGHQSTPARSVPVRIRPSSSTR